VSEHQGHSGLNDYDAGDSHSSSVGVDSPVGCDREPVDVAMDKENPPLGYLPGLAAFMRDGHVAGVRSRGSRASGLPRRG
jgi:hypothetical protein